MRYLLYILTLTLAPSLAVRCQAIKTLLYILTLTLAPSPAVRCQAIKTISTVKMSGKRLLQLINDILDAAKMKQGAIVIKHERVSSGVGLGECTSWTAGRHRHQAREGEWGWIG